jgi:hypothetical protein
MEEKVADMEKKTSYIDKYCADCKYYMGNCDNTLCCNYIFIEDKRRPCDPGKGCTVKVKRKRRRKVCGSNA